MYVESRPRYYYEPRPVYVEVRPYYDRGRYYDRGSYYDRDRGDRHHDRGGWDRHR